MTHTTAMPRRRPDASEATEDTVAVTIRFPAELRKRALGVAQDEDRSFSSLVVYALRRYVTEHERQGDR
jgi:predicted transcriptional regulator